MISMESGPPGVRITAARNVLVVVVPVPVVVPVVVDMFASHGRVTSRHPSVEPHRGETKTRSLNGSRSGPQRWTAVVSITEIKARWLNEPCSVAQR
jgi:hypothetical protein